jgi:opacity protein-like surface antigen
VNYWIPGWLGFGGALSAGQGSNTDGNLAGFDGNAAGGSRTNFPSGWFVGSERNSFGLNMSGINQTSAFGSLYSEGAQFGYNFKNSPVSIHAGFDALKYDAGIGGNVFAPFDSASSTTAGYGAHAGFEYKPTSNLSLSLDLGYAQQNGRIDTDTKSPSLSTTSQFDLVGGRR